MNEDKIKQIATEVFNQQLRSTQFNVSSVPYHLHNQTDSPNIPPTSVTNFVALPATTGGVLSATNIGVSTPPYGIIYPTPVINGYGVGGFSQFNEGNAPFGTMLLFQNSGIPLYQLWVMLEDGLGNPQWVNIDFNSSDASFDTVTIKEGLSSSTVNVGGVAFDHFVNAGNTTTSETDLYSDTIPANGLGTDGDKLAVEYGGVYVSSGTATRQIRIYFGGSVIFDTGALTLSLSSAWTAYVSIIRVSATIIRYMISFTTEGAALAAYTAVGELTGLTLSNSNIIKITGQAAGVGAATNDIVAKLGTGSWYPAA